MERDPDPNAIAAGAFVLETARLLLRDFRADDLAAVNAFRRDPETIRFMQMEPETMEASTAWLDGAIRYNAIRPREGYNLAIVTREDERVIGWIGFGDSEKHPGRENHGVGYMLHSAEWGKGYATEALAAAINFMLDGLGGERVWAWCFAANGASERVMQKAGMVFACEFPDEETGDPCREYVFARA